MQSKHDIKFNSFIVQKYIKQIIDNNHDNVAVQNLILMAAEEGLLPELHKVNSSFIEFKGTDSIIIKSIILDELFQKQNDWFEQEELRQKLNSESETIERNIIEEQKKLKLKAKLTKVHTLLLSDEKFLKVNELDNIIERSLLPIVIKYKDKIWIYGGDHKRVLRLTESSSLDLYEKLDFDVHPQLIESSKITHEIDNDIQWILKGKHLENQLKKKKKLISKIETRLKNLKDKQKGLILEVSLQSDYFLSIKDVEQYYRKIEKTAENIILPKIKEEIIKLIQMSQKSENWPIVCMLDGMKIALYSNFRFILQNNICLILSRESQDKERQFLIQHLQKSEFIRNTDVEKKEQDKLIQNNDFNGADLSDAYFHDTDFSGATFKSAILKRTRFRKIDLKNVNFTNADLEKADFSGADLKGANFTNANLLYVKLTSTLKNDSILVADFEPQQLLFARSLRGIKIGFALIRDKYNLEDKEALWNKLFQDYEDFFTHSNDAEEILKEVHHISPYMKLYNKSTLFHLSQFLNKDYNKIFRSLLNIALKRALLLIQQGASITDNTQEHLFNICIPILEYHNEFILAIHNNKPYHAFLDRMKSLDKYLEEPKNRDHEDYHKKINDSLIAAFAKIYYLSRNNHIKVADAFAKLKDCLAGLYDDVDYSITLISLFFTQSLNLGDSDNPILFYAAETLFTAKGNLGFSNQKEKYQLIWFFLENSKDEQALNLKKQVFNILKSNEETPSISNSSLEEMVGVDFFLYRKDLETLIGCNLTALQLAEKSINNPNTEAEVKKSAENILKFHEDLKNILNKIRGKTVVFYEELVLDLHHPNVLTIPSNADGQTIVNTLLRAFPLQTRLEYYENLRKKMSKYLNKLKEFILAQFEEEELASSIDSSRKPKENSATSEMQPLFQAPAHSFTPATLKSLIDEIGHLPKIDYLWLFFKNKGKEVLKENEKLYFDHYTKIQIIPPKEMTYLNQAKEMLLVLEEYVKIFNARKDSDFRKKISSILIELNELFTCIDQLIVKKKSEIVTNDNNSNQINTSFVRLENAIDEAEQKLKEMGENDCEFIANLPSQISRIAKLTADNLELSQKLNGLSQKFKIAQYTLYGIIAVSVMTSIVLGALVILTYLAIPLGIAVTGFIIAEIIRQKRNETELKIQTNQPITNDPKNLKDYINTDLKQEIQPIVESTYSLYKKSFPIQSLTIQEQSPQNVQNF